MDSQMLTMRSLGRCGREMEVLAVLKLERVL